jgi:hypothetical protein
MYEDLAMRHLHDSDPTSDLRNDSWLKKLEEFIKGNKGKKYRLNPLDLFKSQATKSPEFARSVSTDTIPIKNRLKNSTSFNDSRPLMPGEEEGFFCSELVAAAYQALGMLPEERPPSTYWPSTLVREDINAGMLGGTKLSRLVYLERK